MKTASFALGSILLLAVGSAPAASTETSSRPVPAEAQAVIDRVTAAYAAMNGWNSTTSIEWYSIQGGAEVLTSIRKTERYLKTNGLTGYYAIQQVNDGVGVEVIVQNQETLYRIMRAKDKVGGFTASPEPYYEPEMMQAFNDSVKSTGPVRHVGTEVVDGQKCDILEFPSNIDPTVALRMPAKFLGRRYYVNAAGFIVRSTLANGNIRFDEHVALDAQAQLTAADFSRESFERDAAVLLDGKPMPVLKEMLFARGETLPPVTILAWPDQQPFRLDDFKGKVVVIETWASWCHFCKEAFPFYEKTRRALVAQDVVFVAISFDHVIPDYEKWMKAHGAEYGFKFGRIDSPDPKKALKEFRGSAPAFYVLGRDGKIVRAYVGFSDEMSREDTRLLTALREAGVNI